MIADALRSELDCYAAEVGQRNPLFARAREGALPGKWLERYTASLRYILGESPRGVARARDVAARRGVRRLVEHLGRHLERTASSAQGNRLAPSDVAGAAHELVASVESDAIEDPVLALAHLLFVDMLPSLESAWRPGLGAGAERRPSAGSGGDIGFDEDRVEMHLECIDDVVGDPRQLPRLREALRKTMNQFDRMCEEVAASARDPEAERPDAETLVKRYPLPAGWSAPEVIEDTIVVNGVELRRAGLATRGPTGEEIVGSAADTSVTPIDRAYFELLERVAIVEAMGSRRNEWPLYTRGGEPAGKAPSRLVFPESDEPARWRHARSNGVALHLDWERACDRAWWELCERDHVLRAWYGETVPERIDSGDAARLPAPARYDWRAYAFPAAAAAGFSRGLSVRGVFGFPLDEGAPFACGFAARPSPDAALLAAAREALQLLGFLWGEALPTAPPAPSPTPAYHLDHYQHPGRRDALVRWLGGAHTRYPRTPVARPRDASIAFVDLTPPWLAGLRVCKALCPDAEPLAFGDAPFGAHLPAELRPHPIA